MNHHSIIPASSEIIPDKYAPRHALLNVFHKSAARRLTLVTAPAGSGKTMTTKLWLQSAQRTSLWLQMTQKLNSPAEFYAALCWLILQEEKYMAGKEDVFTDISFTSQPAQQAKAFIGRLAEDGSRLYALVIDDLHLLTDEETLKSLPDVLIELPYYFTTFVLSRNKPTEQFSRLIRQGKSSLLTGDELAFTAEEIGDYFRICGRRLSDSQIETAYQMTDGWAMGVNALALTGSLLLEKRNKNLDGYLPAHIWEDWEEDLRRFLLQTSVAEELTPVLCDRLTGRRDSAQVLEQLHRVNTFIMKNDSDSYRYHPLFLKFLQKKRHQEKMDENALYRTAAAYYQERELPYEALRASVKGGYTEGIISGMYKIYRYSTLGNSVAWHANMLKTYLIDLVPDETLTQNPYILVNFTWYHYLMGNAKSMLYYIDRIYDNFQFFQNEYRTFYELGLLITTLDFRKPPTGIAPEVEEIRLPSDRSTMQTVTMTENMPFFHRSNRDYSDYSLNFQEHFDSFSRALGAILGEKILHLARLGLLSGLLYEQDRMEEARKLADEVLYLLEHLNIVELRMGAFMLRAAIAFTEKENAAFTDMFRQAKELTNKENAGHLTPNMLATEMKFLLNDAKKQDAKQWLSHYFVTDPEQPEFYKMYQHFATARAFTVLNQPEKAIKLLKHLKRLGTDFMRPLDIAEAEILLAAIAQALGKKQEAADILTETLLAMQKYGFKRLLIDEGAAIAPILKKILKEMGKEKYSGSLDYSYVKDIYEKTLLTADHHKGVTANIKVKSRRISDRQLRILQLLSQGYRQADIAEETGLAPATVKSHLYAVYQKLEVGNARDAVARARQQGLLEEEPTL